MHLDTRARVRVFSSSLRTRLLAYVLLAVLPAFALVLYMSTAQRRYAVDFVNRNALRLVRLAAEEHQQITFGTYQLLIAMARLPEVRDHREAECMGLLTTLLKQNPLYTTLGAMTPEGDVFCSAPPLSQPWNFADRAFFRRALETHGFVIGDYRLGANTDVAALSIVYPVLDAGGQTRVLVYAALNLMWIDRLATSVQLPPASQIIVFDHRGTILARYPHPERWVGQTVPESRLFRAIREGRGEGTIELAGQDGNRRLFAYAPLAVGSGERVYMAVGIPREAALAEPNKVMVRGLLALGLVSLLVLAAAWFGGDLFVLRGVNSLVGAAERLRKGDFSARTGLPSQPGELGQLAGVMDDLAAALEQRQGEIDRANDEIRQLNADLERRVAERTRQLEIANREIAERERTIWEREQAQTAILETSPDAILFLELNGRVQFVSSAIRDILGYTEEERIGGHAFDFIHPEDRDRYAEALRDLVETGQPVQVRHRRRRATGEWVTLETHGRRMDDPTGAPTGLVLVARNVTEQVQMEEALRLAKQEADRANQAKSEFLSRMSHELRTPLNAILGFAQLMEIGAPEAIRAKGVTHILKSGRHLLDLINEILDIARIESGRLALSPEPVVVGDIVQEVFGMLRPLADQRGIALSNPTPDDRSWRVEADRQRLKQVLLNLVSNAIKYGRDGSTVTVTSQGVSNDRLRMNVADTGVGIAGEHLTKIFQPFERAGQDEVEGTGLGLALSRRLVEAMGGTIGVESVAGEGSTFWVELPVAAEGPNPRQALDGLEPEPLVASRPVDSRTILYIEDNLPNLSLIECIADYRPGLKLVTAMQGRLGLDLARNQGADLILLDLHLPDLQGEEVLRLLRADAKTRQIPVVVITADATPGQAARILRAGARAYLTKPLDVQRLLTIFDDTLRPRSAAGHAG